MYVAGGGGGGGNWDYGSSGHGGHGGGHGGDGQNGGAIDFGIAKLTLSADLTNFMESVKAMGEAAGKSAEGIQSFGTVFAQPGGSLVQHIPHDDYRVTMRHIKHPPAPTVAVVPGQRRIDLDD
jgi:hypothetical protein